MAVSFIGAASALADTVTLSAHQSGDLILITARRGASTVPPDLATGYTNIQTGNKSGPDVAARMGYKIAASSSETSGTWTNAGVITARIYRGTAATVGVNIPAAAAGTSATVTVPAVTLEVGDGTSWVAGESVYAVDPTGIPHTITGMTNRVIGTAGTPRQEGYDTAAGVASWAGTTFTIGSTSWISLAAELKAAGTATGAAAYHRRQLMDA